MQNTSLSEINHTNIGIKELEALAEKAANAFKPFLGADGFDLEQYKQFLNTMYHYTGKSAEMISHAGNIAHDEVLKDYFQHMLREEKSHYILAREDLRELGSDVSEDIPESVKRFHENWFALGESIYPYLGAIYVFENIAKKIQLESESFYKRLNLNKKQHRWISVHLEADLEHGEEIAHICTQYYDNDPIACTAGAKIMCFLWINVFSNFEQ